MRKPNNANKFVSRLVARERTVQHLKQMNNPDARRQLKQMNVINCGAPKTNLKGSWCPIKSSPRPIKCSVKNKTRHTTAASKRIMRGLA